MSLFYKVLIWICFRFIAVFFIDMFGYYWFCRELVTSLDWLTAIIILWLGYLRLPRIKEATFALGCLTAFELYSIIDTLWLTEMRCMLWRFKSVVPPVGIHKAIYIEQLIYDGSYEISMWSYYSISWIILVSLVITFLCHAYGVKMHKPKFIERLFG